MLTNKEILEEMEKGKIIIDPFDISQLEDCSYNLAVGPWIARYKNFIGPFGNFFRDEMSGFDSPVFGLDPTTYDPAQVFKLEKCSSHITIAPGERILGHTLEFAGGVSGINTHLQAKSTTQRVGLSVCLDAGFGNVGYFNRWTLEISNHSPLPINLPVGTLVAQIIFHRVGELLEGSLYHDRGNYQDHESFEKLKEEWSPESMLPKKMKVRG